MEISYHLCTQIFCVISLRYKVDTIARMVDSTLHHGESWILPVLWLNFSRVFKYLEHIEYCSNWHIQAAGYIMRTLLHSYSTPYYSLRTKSGSISNSSTRLSSEHGCTSPILVLLLTVACIQCMWKLVGAEEHNTIVDLMNLNFALTAVRYALRMHGPGFTACTELEIVLILLHARSHTSAPSVRERDPFVN